MASVSVRYPNVATVPKSASASIIASATPTASAGRAMGKVTSRKGRPRERPRLGEGGAREEIHVGIEDQHHHGSDAAVRADLGQPEPWAQPGPESRLHRSREVEEAEEGEADDVGGDGQRRGRRPIPEG